MGRFDAGRVLRRGTKRPFSPRLRFLANYLISQYVLSFVFANLPLDALCFQDVLSFVFCGHSVPAWNAPALLFHAALPRAPTHRASLPSLTKLHKAKLAQRRAIVKREVRKKRDVAELLAPASVRHRATDMPPLCSNQDTTRELEKAQFRPPPGIRRGEPDSELPPSHNFRLVSRDDGCSSRL